MSYQQNIREQITNRCNRIAKLVKLNAPGIILDNENSMLQESLKQYEQNDIVSEPKFEKDSVIFFICLSLSKGLILPLR